MQAPPMPAPPKPAPVTADIIPFPQRPRNAFVSVGSGQTVDASGDSAQERLARALAKLDTALTEQKVAIATWRASLGALKSTVQGIGQSLAHYQISLDKLGADMQAANNEAKAMESWADSILAGAAQGVAKPN